MRTHAEWNVEIHMPSAAPPTRCCTRSRISLAALLVKVIARIWLGHASRDSSRLAMRWVSTRVLPEPAPATISRAGPRYSTASRCCGLSPSSSGEEASAGVLMRQSSLGEGSDSGAGDPAARRYRCSMRERRGPAEPNASLPLRWSSYPVRQAAGLALILTGAALLLPTTAYTVALGLGGAGAHVAGRSSPHPARGGCWPRSGASRHCC